MLKRTIVAMMLALLAGCASTPDAYIEAQKAALVRESDARVAEAQAIAAVAGKLDAGGAAAYAVMVAARGSQPQPYAARVDRPRDWLDYAQGIAGIVGTLGNIAVPIASIRASRDVSIAGFNRDIGLAQAQQAGESARIQSVSQIATSVANAPRPPTTTNTYTVTAGGDSIIQGGSIDRRNCPTTAGNGAGNGPITLTIPPTGSAMVTTPPGANGGNAAGGC